MGKLDNLDLLHLVGEALYGERWQAPIAVDLGVSDRAVRYWLSKTSPCPDDIGNRLLQIVIHKREALADLENMVRSHTSPEGARP